MYICINLRMYVLYFFVFCFVLFLMECSYGCMAISCNQTKIKQLNNLMGWVYEINFLK